MDRVMPGGEIPPDEKGSVIVFVALAMTVLLGLAAIVVDVGILYFNRVALSNAADAAALAGVQELPADPGRAEAAAVAYAVKNGVEESRVTTTLPDSRSIRVTVSRTVPLGFGRIFGMAASDVGASAKATIGTASAVRGAAPFVVPDQEFVYGERYVLKYGGGAGEHGNFAGLALGGWGATNYENNIKYGYQGWLCVDEWQEVWLDTEPGNMSGPTVRGVTYRISQCHHSPPCTFDHCSRTCPRVVLVPVADFDPEELHGRSQVRLVGFAAFFLEGVWGCGRECEVTGRFLRWVADGEPGGAGYYGVVASRLEE
ncbi:MAG: pilus assembly protein TadG-related protein [Bacillota bacterium]